MDRGRQIQSHAGLRGIAAMLVVAYHLQFGGAYHVAIEDATPFLRRCYLFVDLFFVLSGFILSYINKADQCGSFSPQEYFRFMMRRLIRLYPLLFCTLVFMLAERALYTLLLGSTGHHVWLDWSGGSLLILASQFLLLNAWYAGPSGWNVPTWSISAEMTAYLLFPVFVNGWIRQRALTLVGLATLSVSFYAWLFVTDRWLDIIGGLAPLRCIAGFSLGMLLYRARRHVAQLPETALSIIQAGCVAGTVIVLAAGLPDPVAVLFFGGLVITTWTDRGIVAHLLSRRAPTYLGRNLLFGLPDARLPDRSVGHRVARPGDRGHRRLRSSADPVHSLMLRDSAARLALDIPADRSAGPPLAGSAATAREDRHDREFAARSLNRHPKYSLDRR